MTEQQSPLEQQSPSIEEQDPILLKLVYLVFFCIVYAVSRFLLFGVVVFQSIYALVTGEPQADLRRFTLSLSIYIGQLIRYLGWVFPEKPFPFADWPAPVEQTRSGGESDL
jgi:hypothetical protein